MKFEELPKPDVQYWKSVLAYFQDHLSNKANTQYQRDHDLKEIERIKNNIAELEKSSNEIQTKNSHSN